MSQLRYRKDRFSIERLFRLLEGRWMERSRLRFQDAPKNQSVWNLLRFFDFEEDLMKSNIGIDNEIAGRFGTEFCFGRIAFWIQWRSASVQTFAETRQKSRTGRHREGNAHERLWQYCLFAFSLQTLSFSTFCFFVRQKD